jgi:hypothetical protein
MCEGKCFSKTTSENKKNVNPEIIASLETIGVNVQMFCLPNYGTEAYAYFVHIAKFYDTLGDYTAFVQGHALDYYKRCRFAQSLSILREVGYVGLGEVHRGGGGQARLMIPSPKEDTVGVVNSTICFRTENLCELYKRPGE